MTSSQFFYCPKCKQFLFKILVLFLIFFLCGSDLLHSIPVGIELDVSEGKLSSNSLACFMGIFILIFFS